MSEHWDVQKDHQKFISRLMENLSAEGELIFSNNMKKFKIDESLSEKFNVENITHQTLDQDFQQRNHVHQCFIISHKDSN
jgi:23S rRNA (guanine2445-N2)-methyltransferase / 23S rRNA (guanine2069-N7)-methyltransferase